MIRLTGLWESTTKSGEFMLSGSLGGAKLIVLPNNRRTGDKSPTHTLLIAEREDQVSDVTRRASGTGRGQTGERYGNAPPPANDDAPF